jgi:Protein of unknown function (DUF2442)
MIRMEQLHDVVAVEVVGEFRLRLSFDDGTVGEVDLSKRAWEGVLEPLGNPAYFATRKPGSIQFNRPRAPAERTRSY